jgi:hypothetical protein
VVLLCADPVHGQGGTRERRNVRYFPVFRIDCDGDSGQVSDRFDQVDEEEPFRGPADHGGAGRFLVLIVDVLGDFLGEVFIVCGGGFVPAVGR